MKLKHTKVATLAATLITFGSLAGGANAALLLTEGAGGNLSITLTQPLSFTTTGSEGTFTRVIFEDVFTANASITTTPAPGGMGTIIPSYGGTIASIWGTSSSSTGIYDPNDLMISWFSSVSSGQVVTISAGTVLTNFAFADYPVITSSSSVSATLANNTSNAISNTISVDLMTASVPEPSSALLLGLGALGIAARRGRTA